MITRERLKELLAYDPLTGLFTWRENRQGHVKAGDVAGYVSDRYVNLKVDGCRTPYYAHRLAFLYMEGTYPKCVDHGNHVRTDNRWANLTGTDHAGNSKNVLRLSTNKSGVCGVCWATRDRIWKAKIGCNGITKNLGSFHNKIDAIIARKMAEYELGFHANHGKEKVNVS